MSATAQMSENQDGESTSTEIVVGIDVGGTFTDAVALTRSGDLYYCKVLTTPDQSSGVIAALHEVVAQAGATLAEVDFVAHGTTVATNALLERKGARTAAVLTNGFTDLLHIARQTRPSLYEQWQDRPAPLVDRNTCIACDERTYFDGNSTQLTEAAIDSCIGAVEAAEVTAVAICFVHSYCNDSNEVALASALRERFPDVHIVASHEISHEFREFERASTTTIDAALTPILGPYLSRLDARLAEHDINRVAVMQSHGGLDDLAKVASHAARAVLSGPAGGCVAAASLREELDVSSLICFDMGGTSCDVARVNHDGVGVESGRMIGGLPLQLATVDMHTIGSGGSSIVWIDSGGGLRVGPQSAGSHPGPACYGQGGVNLTVTDAHLLLGNLTPTTLIHWGIELDRSAANIAANRLSASDPLEIAAAAIALANVQMAEAVRVVSVARGHDPSHSALLAYGGAGGLHACDVAREVGCPSVIFTSDGGVLSALGLALAPRMREHTRTFTVSVESPQVTSQVMPWIDHQCRRLIDGMDVHRCTFGVTAYCRYSNQSHTLALTTEFQALDPHEIGQALSSLHDRFCDVHHARYGFLIGGGDVVLDTARVFVREQRSWSQSIVQRRFPGFPQRRAAQSGTATDLPNGTCLIPSGWSCEYVGTCIVARDMEATTHA